MVELSLSLLDPPIVFKIKKSRKIPSCSIPFTHLIFSKQGLHIQCVILDGRTVIPDISS